MLTEKTEKELAFVMRLGGEMKQLMLKSFVDEYKDQQDLARMVFNFIPNFVCNVLMDISAPNFAKENIQNVIDTMQHWITEHSEKPEGTISVGVHYNAQTDSVKIDEIH